MVIAGAVCATALAELGADVIKIESPTVPDTTRRLRLGEAAVHEPSGMETSPMFANFNRSVRSLALDMKQPESVDLVLRLASVADVVLENFGPDVLERWGVGYEKIAAVNPRIVMLSQTGFGHTGPRSHYLAYGATIFSFMGLTQIWGRSHGTAPGLPRRGPRAVRHPGRAGGPRPHRAGHPHRPGPDRGGRGDHGPDAARLHGQRARTRRGPAARHGGPLPAARMAGWPSSRKTTTTGSAWPGWPAPRSRRPRRGHRSARDLGRRAHAAAGDADAAAGWPGRRRGPEQRGRDPRPRAPRAALPAGDGSSRSRRGRVRQPAVPAGQDPGHHPAGAPRGSGSTPPRSWPSGWACRPRKARRTPGRRASR